MPTHEGRYPSGLKSTEYGPPPGQEIKR